MKCMKSSVRMRQWGGVDAKNIKEIANKEIPPSCNFIGKFQLQNKFLFPYAKMQLFLHLDFFIFSA